MIEEQALQAHINAEPVVRIQGEESLEALGQVLLRDTRIEVAWLNLSPAGLQLSGFPCSHDRADVFPSGQELSEQGLLSEWLSELDGAVVVVAGGEALLDAVYRQVGERLREVAADEAALALLRTVLVS